MPFILYPRTRKGKIFLLLIAVFVVAVAVFTESPENSRRSAGTDYSIEKVIVSPHCFGCNTQDNFDRALEMLRVGDSEAFARMMLTGRCVSLPVGSTIYIEDRVIFSGLVQVRSKGKTITLWTLSESVK